MHSLHGMNTLPDIRVIQLDPKDDVIMATAVKVKADFLVTGDRHLLSLGSHAGMESFFSTRAFLDLL